MKGCNVCSLTFSLSIMSSRSIQVAANGRISFLFRLLWIMLQFTWEFRYLYGSEFMSFGYIFRSRTARSYIISFLIFSGNIILFSIIHNHHFVFPPIVYKFSNLSIVLTTYFYPLCFVLFLVITDVAGLRWYLIVIFNLLSLIMNRVEQFFMYLSVICMFLWGNV